MVLIYFGLWLLSRKTYPVKFGISFNHNHAESMGLDWREVYTDMLEELKPEYIRIAAMWSEVEREKGVYDFEKVDWMMQKAQENNAKVVLVVGQKAPRWPECHVPGWINDDGETGAREHLFGYIEQTVNRYKDNSALEFWQVENEPFIKFRFGECSKYREDYVVEEIQFVRDRDANHPIILTDSGELSSWRKAIKYADYFGTTLYRVVRQPDGGIFDYDWMPPAVYRFKAMLWGQEIDKMFVSELQAEPWFETTVHETPWERQKELMNPDKFAANVAYATSVGFEENYFWGVEWWYWARQHGYPEMWEAAKKLMSEQ